MAEIKVGDMIMCDKDGNELWRTDGGLATIAPSENNDVNDTWSVKFKADDSKLSRWRFVKLAYDYDNLSSYYKFRIWLGFWFNIG